MRVGVVDGGLTRELRRSVLRPSFGPGDPLPGDDLPADLYVVHLAAVDDDGTARSTCFVYAEPCPWRPGEPAWHLRQMASDPAYRGAGLGRAVVSAAADTAIAAGAAVLWCNARESARPFYERCGFIGHGGVFTDEQHVVPHRQMWRRLGPVTP